MILQILLIMLLSMFVALFIMLRKIRLGIESNNTLTDDEIFEIFAKKTIQIFLISLLSFLILEFLV
jgi:sulfatase maturation enzyme AslB (radical SAM superfamily)